MPSRKDDVELPKNFGSYCRICIDMERHGLTCFDEGGNYGGHDGEVIILGILIVFEQLEMYKDCAFLRDFLAEYRNKFRSEREPTIEEHGGQSYIKDLVFLLS